MKGALSLALTLAALALARPATAGEPTAAELYDWGAAAYDAGDYTHAVGFLAHADAIAPDAVTLEMALKAALKADDAASGMDLAERADGRKVPPAVSTLATQARGRFAAHAGKVHAACACETRLDDAPMNNFAWATIGRHTVSFVRNGKTDRVAVTVVADKTAEAAPPAVAPPTAPAPVAETSGVSPVWFWIAAGVTVAAGIATGASMADTVSKHDTFVLDRSNTAASDAGASSQTRTNALGIATGGAALITVALGAFVVRW